MSNLGILLKRLNNSIKQWYESQKQHKTLVDIVPTASTTINYTYPDDTIVLTVSDDVSRNIDALLTELKSLSDFNENIFLLSADGNKLIITEKINSIVPIIIENDSNNVEYETLFNQDNIFFNKDLLENTTFQPVQSLFNSFNLINNDLKLVWDTDPLLSGYTWDNNNNELTINNPTAPSTIKTITNNQCNKGYGIQFKIVDPGTNTNTAELIIRLVNNAVPIYFITIFLNLKYISLNGGTPIAFSNNDTLSFFLDINKIPNETIDIIFSKKSPSDTYFTKLDTIPFNPVTIDLLNFYIDLSVNENNINCVLEDFLLIFGSIKISDGGSGSNRYINITPQQ